MHFKKFLIALLLVSSVYCQAQNFSGLLNKRLNKIDDISSLLETGIGSLFGGKINGQIDSVVVTHDAEKSLKVKIWFKEYTNGFFTVSVMNDAKKKQGEITVAKFSQAAKPSPFECILSLSSEVIKGTKIESPYLRIDVAKKENGIGNVSVFGLNKKWKNELDPQNVVVNVSLQPVGKAASLSMTEAKDITPGKMILFIDPKILSQPLKPLNKNVITPRGGGYSFREKIKWDISAFSDDISGTWVNAAGQTGLLKIVIAKNNSIHAYFKCPRQDCDWGTTALSDLGNNNFRAIFDRVDTTSTLNIVYTANQLTINLFNRNKANGSTRASRYTFKKELPLMLNVRYSRAEVASMRIPPTASGQPVDKTIKGPDKDKQFYLFDGLSADVDFTKPQDISNISMNVFPDKNPNSGIYYMLPADYHLRWQPETEPEKGYGFNISYGALRSGGEEAGTDAPVRMSATLTAGISSRERNFVKALLKSTFSDFVDLRFLPLREKPEFTFQNTLGAQYNIPKERITVLTSTDLSNDIQVSWYTDAGTKDFIQEALTSHEGIAASVILKPDDEEIVDQQIPAIINLADIRTIGKINLEPVAWRSRNLRNTSPYPLKLKYLHVLKKEINGTKPIIYSWTMNDAIVPSLGQASFDVSRVPAWLDKDLSVVMWVDYSVEDCRECDQKVMDAVTGGVSGSRTQQIKFTIPPQVFDSLNVSYFMITVRSRQVDPKGEEMGELPSVKILKEASTEISAGSLFVSPDAAVEFEFKITAATVDGDFYPSEQWIRWTAKEVLLGKTKMKEIFRGIIPGNN